MENIRVRVRADTRGENEQKLTQYSEHCRGLVNYLDSYPPGHVPFTTHRESASV